MSGVVSLAIGIALRVGRSVSETMRQWSDTPDWLFICIGVLCLFWVGYAAWQTEHRELERLKSKEVFLATCPDLLIDWSGNGDVPIAISNVGKRIAHRVQFVKFQNGVEWDAPKIPTIGAGDSVSVRVRIHEEVSETVNNSRSIQAYLRNANLPLTICLTFRDLRDSEQRHLTKRFTVEATGAGIGFFALPLEMD